MAHLEGGMEKRQMGRDGPGLSVIGYGAWEAGGSHHGQNPPDEELFAAMHAAFDGGVNWVDTAERYGRSEELVGQAIEGRDIVVCTKVAPLRLVDGRPTPTGMSAAEIRDHAEASLERLRRDVFDIYLLHGPPPSDALQTTWEGLAELAQDGLARTIGICNVNREQVERCERIRHVDTVQIHLSLLHQEALTDLVPYCRAHGIGVQAYGVLGFGLLTGTMTPSTTFPDNDWRGNPRDAPGPQYRLMFAPDRFQQHLRTVEALKPVADRLGVPLAQLALAWALQQDGVTSALVGSRSATRMRENLAATALRLQPQDMEEVQRRVTGTP